MVASKSTLELDFSLFSLSYLDWKEGRIIKCVRPFNQFEAKFGFFFFSRLCFRTVMFRNLIQKGLVIKIYCLM